MRNPGNVSTALGGRAQNIFLVQVAWCRPDLRWRIGAGTIHHLLSEPFQSAGDTVLIIDPGFPARKNLTAQCKVRPQVGRILWNRGAHRKARARNEAEDDARDVDHRDLYVIPDIQRPWVFDGVRTEVPIEGDRTRTRLNSSTYCAHRMPSAS